MTAAPTPPTLHTIDEIAARLHLHPQTVRQLIKRGELGHVQSGRYKLVSDEQYAKYVAARSIEVA